MGGGKKSSKKEMGGNTNPGPEPVARGDGKWKGGSELVGIVCARGHRKTPPVHVDQIGTRCPLGLGGGGVRRGHGKIKGERKSKSSPMWRENGGIIEAGFEAKANLKTQGTPYTCSTEKEKKKGTRGVHLKS